MDRRDPKKKPRPEMVWSERHRMWVDPDTRSPETKKRHEEIARDMELRCPIHGPRPSKG